MRTEHEQLIDRLNAAKMSLLIDQAYKGAHAVTDAIAELERLAAENAALRAVADMVELRSLMDGVRADSDDDDGGRQVVINLMSLRDEFASEANDERFAVRAVIVQDGLSYVHRLVKQQTEIAEDKLRLLKTVAALRAEAERLTPRGMTLQQACDVLTKDGKGDVRWVASADGKYAMLYGDDPRWVVTRLRKQDAIYIAQGLERDAKGGG